VAFSVYPNPTNGTYTIAAPTAGKFAIFSIDGRLVTEFDVTDNISSHTLPGYLVEGMYMCRFIGNDGAEQIVRLIYRP
jgi:hypothetical protein